MYNRANYYFLISAFPPLTLGVAPPISFREAKDLLLLNLTPEDMEQVALLLRSIDLYNIRALWLGEPLDDRGNLNGKELEEALLIRDMLPSYFNDFLDRYESTQDRLRYFSSLFASLYRDEKLKGFLLEYYRFERELRLCLTALRAKRAGRDLLYELQFEDPTDPLIADILAQKDSAEYTPPGEFEEVKTLFLENRSDPRKLDRAISEYRFKKIEEMEQNQDFSINRVLAYIARLMVDESLVADPEKGKEELRHYE